MMVRHKLAYTLLLLTVLAVFLIALLRYAGGGNVYISVCPSGGFTARLAKGSEEDVIPQIAAAFKDYVPQCIDAEEVQKERLPMRKFFFESRGRCAGQDFDRDNGVNFRPFFFFVGHGNPVDWPTRTDKAFPGCMKLGGDGVAGSGLRYYWQCSCQVFAHGPSHLGVNYSDYSEPWKYATAGREERRGMQNLFDRWGLAINNGMRLACGASTALACSPDQIRQVWTNKLGFFDVSDSFLVGLHSKEDVIPICITKQFRPRGSGPVPQDSALFDHAFLLKPGNPPRVKGMSGYYLIEYPEDFSSNREDGKSAAEALPIVSLEGVVDRGVDYFYKEFDADVSTVGQERVQLYHDDPASMPLLKANCPRESVCGEEGFFLDSALIFLRHNRWLEKDMGRPSGLRLLIDALPVDGGDIVRYQKGVVIRFRRMVTGGGSPASEDEFDGNIVLWLNNAGEVARAWKSWLRAGKSSHSVSLRRVDLDRLKGEALRIIGPSKVGYLPLGQPKIIYRRKNDELIPFALFVASPRHRDTLMSYPPLRVEVPVL